MNEKKQPGFIIYGEFEEQVNMLSDSDAGLLLRALFRYANDGEVVEMPPMVKMIFSVMKRRIDLQAEKYAEICRKRSEAGKKGNQTRWGNDNIANATKCEQEVASVANKNTNINQTETETKAETKIICCSSSRGSASELHTTTTTTTNITAEQRAVLVDMYGEEAVGDYICRMDEYLTNSGKKPYKNHFATIKRWMKEDGVKMLDKPSFDIAAIEEYAKRSVPSI